MQYSISAFFLKEVSDMDVYEKLEELQEKALHDDTIRKTLLKTREEKEPILAFCKRCQEPVSYTHLTLPTILLV